MAAETKTLKVQTLSRIVVMLDGATLQYVEKDQYPNRQTCHRDPQLAAPWLRSTAEGKLNRTIFNQSANSRIKCPDTGALYPRRQIAKVLPATVINEKIVTYTRIDDEESGEAYWECDEESMKDADFIF